MLPIKSIIFDKFNKTDLKNSIINNFSQQIRLLIFIDFRYNQLILSNLIERYRLLSILLIAHVGHLDHYLVERKAVWPNAKV